MESSMLLARKDFSKFYVMRYVLTMLLAVIITVAFVADAYAKRPNPGMYRMKKFGELRCGYVDHPPYIYTDSFTGEVQGPLADIAENMVGFLRVGVKWVKEDDMSRFVESLNNNEYEAFCGILPDTADLKDHVLLTDPAFNIKFHAYARAGDERFTDADALKQDGVEMFEVEGSISQILINTYFPSAAVQQRSADTKPEKLIGDFAAGETDILIYDPVLVDRYMREHAGQIVRIFDEPIETVPTVMAIGKHNESLHRLINISLNGVHSNSKANVILFQYDISDDLVGRPESDLKYGSTPDDVMVDSPCAGNTEMTKRLDTRTIQEALGGEPVEGAEKQACKATMPLKP